MSSLRIGECVPTTARSLWSEAARHAARARATTWRARGMSESPAPTGDVVARGRATCARARAARVRAPRSRRTTGVSSVAHRDRRRGDGPARAGRRTLEGSCTSCSGLAEVWQRWKPLTGTSSLKTKKKKKKKTVGPFPELQCHPCAGAMLIFSVSFQF